MHKHAGSMHVAQGVLTWARPASMHACMQAQCCEGGARLLAEGAGEVGPVGREAVQHHAGHGLGPRERHLRHPQRAGQVHVVRAPLCPCIAAKNSFSD